MQLELLVCEESDLRRFPSCPGSVYGEAVTRNGKIELRQQHPSASITKLGGNTLKHWKHGGKHKECLLAGPGIVQRMDELLTGAQQ